VASWTRGAHYGKDFQYEAFRKLDGKTPNENARGMLRNRRDAALTADGEYVSCAADAYLRRELARAPNGLKRPLFWHIDRFDSAERARTAVGPASVAFEAAGTSWLMTIESQTSNHHGGRHVAQVGPLQLPRAAKYSMQVMSAAFTPRMYSLAHHHSGVEAVYVIEGEACYETPTRAFKLRDGETLALPAGTPMRAVVTGSTLRYVLAVIVYDAAQPPTMRMEEGTGPKLIACR
jgi:quercetin dioxygenase-like cupin family protein